VQNLEVTLYLIQNLCVSILYFIIGGVLSHNRTGFNQFGYCLNPIIFLFSEI
jgi:surface polysaccharide O-acyltransferase-like enzyme